MVLSDLYTALDGKQFSDLLSAHEPEQQLDNAHISCSCTSDCTGICRRCRTPVAISCKGTPNAVTRGQRVCAGFGLSPKSCWSVQQCVAREPTGAPWPGNYQVFQPTIKGFLILIFRDETPLDPSGPQGCQQRKGGGLQRNELETLKNHTNVGPTSSRLGC